MPLGVKNLDNKNNKSQLNSDRQQLIEKKKHYS
jgi:hypothetical protein